MTASRSRSLTGASCQRLTPEIAIEAQRIFGAQEKFDRPIWVDFHATAKDTAFVVEQPGTVWLVARDRSRQQAGRLA